MFNWFKKEDEIINRCANSQEDSDVSESQYKERIKKLLVEISGLNTDLSNIKSRHKTELESAKDSASIEFVKAIAPHLSMLQFSISQECTDQKFKDGISMIKNGLFNSLSDLGIQLVPTNIPFDPNLHDAVNSVDSELSEGSIVSVYADGFTFNGKVILHSKVSVAK